MKFRFLIFVFSLCFLVGSFKAQDSLKINDKTPGFRLGAKIISERSGLLNLVPGTYPVFGCGFQIIKPIKKSPLSIESGFYLVTKGFAYKSELDKNTYRALYRSINIPVNVRLEYKYFYISAGPTLDYFVKQDLSKWLNQSALYTRKVYIGYNSTLGIQFPFKETKCIFFEVRYSKILAVQLTDPPFTNYGFAIGLNYGFGSK